MFICLAWPRASNAQIFFSKSMIENEKQTLDPLFSKKKSWIKLCAEILVNKKEFVGALSNLILLLLYILYYYWTVAVKLNEAATTCAMRFDNLRKHLCTVSSKVKHVIIHIKAITKSKFWISTQQLIRSIVSAAWISGVTTQRAWWVLEYTRIHTHTHACTAVNKITLCRKRHDDCSHVVKRCNEINLSCTRKQEHRVISSELLHHQQPPGEK